ncbi:hypothetical protein BC831DRAFT_80489 [Entophlyctis helioformis]|nr:hypothetical protein BC831DRAFT_80489 [Entophlyctis helioformis]
MRHVPHIWYHFFLACFSLCARMVSTNVLDACARSPNFTSSSCSFSPRSLSWFLVLANALLLPPAWSDALAPPCSSLSAPEAAWRFSTVGWRTIPGRRVSRQGIQSWKQASLT